MNQLNSIILEGNVVRQAELTEPTKGFKICKFPLAVNRFTKKSNGESVEEVSFFDVEAYGKMAESCEKDILKGRGIRVVGRLKQNRWKDSEGKSFSKVFVVAEHIEYKPKFIKTDGTDNTAENHKKSETSGETIQTDTFQQKNETFDELESASAEMEKNTVEEVAVF